MDNETVNRIIDLVEQVGSEAAREGFALAVHYIQVEAIVSIIFAVVALIVTLLVVWKSYLELTMTDDMMDSNVLYFLAAVLGSFALVGEFIVLYTSVMHLLVPQWYAVELLFGLVTGR